MFPPPLHPGLAQAFAMLSAGQVDAAVARIRQVAALGDADGLFTLGDVYWRGVGVAPDLGQAVELFARASAAGQPLARNGLTNLLASGIAIRRDWPAALSRLAEEARVDPRRARMRDLLARMRLTEAGDPASLPAGRPISERPWVRLFPAAFSAAECAFLRDTGGGFFERSVVVADGRQVVDPVRTSDGSTIHWLIEDPATHALNRRLAALTGTPVEHGEPLQVLRYAPGQEYRPHFDWLDEPNRRVMTALVYLNEDYDGGETAFLRTGLALRCGTGDVLVFRSATAEGTLDPLSEHEGRPVLRGTKFLASRWIRSARFTPGPALP